MNSGDKLTYFFTRRIKRWTRCPACNKKMTFSKTKKLWICNDCAYTVTEKEMQDGFALWFCDECGTYLNNQNGFDRNVSKHVCTKCGYLNGTTVDNIKGMCGDCGKVLHNPDTSLCDDCRKERRRKGKEKAMKAGKILGVAAIVAGAYAASSTSEGDDSSGECVPLPDCGDDDEEMDNYPICEVCGEKMTEFDGFMWYTCPECGYITDTCEEETPYADEVIKPKKRRHYSDFELADFCRGGELTED